MADTIPLRSTTGGKAKGTMTVFLQEGRLLFALEAQDVPPSSEAGRLWGLVHRPGRQGAPARLHEPRRRRTASSGIQGPSEKDLAAFPKLYATYARVVVSQETSEDAQAPERQVILSGKLPKGR